MSSQHTKTSQTNNKILQESYWATLCSILSLIAVLSGLIITLTTNTSNSFPHWLQLNIIGHTLISSLVALPLAIYSGIHFKRTVGIRRPLLIFSGLIASITLISLIASGSWIALYGHTERLAWIPTVHAVTAYVTLAFVILHIVAHLINKQQKKRSDSQRFVTLHTNSLRYAGFATLTYVLFIALGTSVYSVSQDNKPVTIENYQYVYGDHPFRPSQTETVSGGFVKTSQIAKSQQCGSCHTDIYQEWLSSTHRQAASDPAYVKNITLLEKNRGIAATRYCEGCHAPVALLTGELTEGGKHGGIPDTPAHNDGVGCMGCHGIAKIEHLNGTASYQFDPKEHYLFDSSDKMLAQRIRNFLIRLNPDKHKQAMNPDIIKSPEMCASCHEQFMDKSMNDWGWVKMQSTYNNWLKSPFSGQKDQHFKTADSQRCQDCHFPLVQGDDPSTDKNGMIRSHRSLGANTVLPTLNEDKAQFEATKQFLQSAKLLVDIEEPYRLDTIQNQQFIDQQLLKNKPDNTPFFLYLGEQAKLQVTVTNRLVGHTFPAGTNDINQAWLHFTVRDAENRIVYESGALNEQLELDKKAHTYHAIPIDRHGKEVWKHDLFRMTGDVYKNVIESGKSDIKEYTFAVPFWAKQPLTATAILKYRKFNQRYAKWVFDHPKPVLPVVDMARDSIIIPLKTKAVAQ